MIHFAIARVSEIGLKEHCQAVSVPISRILPDGRY